MSSPRAGNARRRPGLAAGLAVVAAFSTPARVEPAPAASPPAPAAEDLEFFEKKIRPVLVERCYECHSAGAKKLKGDLHLDTREGVLKGGTTGPAIIPGDPDGSLLIRAIRHADPDTGMPPKKKLPARIVADFEEWVRRGAPDPRVDDPAAKAAAARSHWAFQPPKDPVPPGVKDARWPADPLDRFILAALEAKGLSPAPPADKRTLLRRVTFDLTGLPPTPAETAAFLADDTPDAFDRVVERLLASPRYGERWGRHWLDVVRYTDSFDSRVTGNAMDAADAWRYRDWVVDAFQRDLPYDRFVMEQLAGDLLPGDGPDGFNAPGIVATGLLAIGNWGGGDSDKEKVLTDIVDDQIDVTGRAFLGLTLACARCHDHKFDPILTEDYYGLAGIFFSTRILPNPGPKTNFPDMLRIPLLPPAELERRKRREERIAALEKEIEADRDAQVGVLARELIDRADRLLLAAREASLTGAGAAPPAPAELAARHGVPEPVLRQWLSYVDAAALGLFTAPVRDLLGNKGVHAWKNAPEADTPFLLVNSSDQPAAFLTIKAPPRSVAVHPSPNAGVAIGWRSPLNGVVQVRGRVADADSVCGDGVVWTFSHVQGASARELSAGAIPNGGAQVLSDGPGTDAMSGIPVRAGDLLQLAVLPKREYTCDTTVLELEIAEAGGAGRVWSLARDVVPDLHEGGQGNPHSDSFGHADVWCFYDQARRQGGDHPPDSAFAAWFAAASRGAAADAPAKAAADVRRALLAVDTDVREARRKADAEKSPYPPAAGPDARLYQDLTNPRGPLWAALRGDESLLSADGRARLAAARAELDALRKDAPPPVPYANGAQEGGCPQSAHAGTHDVHVHVRGRYDRLGPLVPRRFPKVLAGENQPPIAEGSGRLPLAQWIASPDNPLTARVMVNRIWKHHFGEGIVRTPNNFGKLGDPPTHPELLDHLARRFVASGWSVKAMHRAIVRSATYRQSGVPAPEPFSADPANLLFGRMGRRRVEAETLRDALLAAAGTLDTAAGGPAVKDLNSGRRTLYLMTVRSDRNTFQSLFDGADPTAIVDRRIDSTVAPQALFLLNHPFALKQARALAGRVLAEGPPDDPGRIRWLYELLYGRPPAEPEIRIGLAALARARAAEPSAVAGGAPELVWDAYCHILICANEFMYVD